MTTGSRNLQIIAWSVLWAALAACLAIVVGGPMWVRAYLRSAMVDYEVTAACKAGSVTLSAGDDMRVLTPDQGERTLSEGWSVETLGGAQAFLDFSDRSPGSDHLGPTVTLEGGTRLAVREVRKPRFRWGRSPRRVVLTAGPATDQPAALSIGTPWDDTVVSVETAQGRVDLAPESRARLEFRRPAGAGASAGEGVGGRAGATGASALRVLAAEGVVTVTNASGTAVLPAGSRTEVALGHAPPAPTSGAENIVVNGGFRAPPEPNGWEGGRYSANAGVSAGEARHEIALGRSIVRFRRTGSEGTSADLYYRQALDVPVGPGAAISVTAELRVLGQSIPGGGAAGTEYPLIIRLRTEDAAGDQCEWPVGFYAVAPEAGSAYRTDNGVAVPLGEWFEFESGDLSDGGNPMGFGNRVPPCNPPVRLLRVEIRASGHDFESELDGVAVWVDPL